MAAIELILIKKPNKDSLELQLQKLGFSNYILNKAVAKNEYFRSKGIGIRDIILVKEYDDCNVIYRAHLSSNKQLEISKKWKYYSILSVYHVTSVNGYHICITEQGKIVRMKYGNGEVGDETNVGLEFVSEKELYEEKIQKDGITYYKTELDTDEEWTKHDIIGQEICDEIFKTYMGNEIDSYSIGLKESYKVYIDRDKLDTTYSKFNFRFSMGNGQFSFLDGQLINKHKFLPLIIGKIAKRLLPNGFTFDIKRNRFIKEFGNFKQVFEFYNSEETDGIYTIMFEPKLKIESKQFREFRKQFFGYGHIDEIYISFNIYQHQKRLSNRYFSLDFERGIELFMPSIDNLVIPYFNYFSSIENILQYVNNSYHKAELLLFLGMNQKAKNLLAHLYTRIYVNDSENLKKTLKYWNKFFSTENILMHAFSPPDEDSLTKLMSNNRE